MAISIVLADENAIVRRGLQALFDSEPDIAVVGVASDGLDVVRLAVRMRPDVLVIDLMMPGFGGAAGPALSSSTRAANPHRDFFDVPQRLSRLRGAEDRRHGIVHKSGNEENLVRAVNEASEGRRFLSLPAIQIAGNDAEKCKADPHETLTRRQREVLQLTAEGKTSTESAAALRISPRTVENHRAMLMERLGLSNHTDLIRHAIRRGLIPLDDIGR